MSAIAGILDATISKRFPSSALLKREFVALLRKPWVFILLLVYLSLIGAMEVLAWPNDNLFRSTLQTHELVEGLTVVLCILVGLVIPGLTATSIVSEKEADTFEPLQMTLITPRGIVYAKILNAAGLMMASLAVTLPFFGVMLFSVGVDYIEIAVVFTSLVTMTIFCAAWGVLASVFSKDTPSAVILCYNFLLIWPLGVYLTTGFFYVLGGLTDILFFRDFSELFVTIFTPPIFMYDEDLTGGKLLLGLFSYLVVAAVLAEIAARKLNRGPDEITAPKAQELATVVNSKSLSKEEIAASIVSPPGAKKTFLNNPFAPMLASAYNRLGQYFLYENLTDMGAIADNLNPLMAKELLYTAQLKSYSLVTLYIRLFIVFAIGFIVCLILGHGNLIGCAVLVILLAPATTGTAISEEYDRGAMDMLRMTLLTPKEIVMGKIWATAASFVPVGLALVLVILYASLSLLIAPIFNHTESMSRADNYAIIRYLLFFPITTITCLAATLSLAMLTSMLRRTSRGTVVLSYLMNLFLYVALPFVAGLIGYAAFFSPFISYLILPYPDQPHFERIFSYSISHAIFWALTAIFVWMSLSIFKSRHMRDS